jgi:hypothetical protein
MTKELLQKYDLEMIEARINTAKKRFLEVLGESSDNEGKRIIEQFLGQLEANDEVSVALREEAQKEIHSFIHKTVPLTSEVAIVLLKMQGTLTMLSMHVQAAALEQLKIPQQEPPATGYDQALRDLMNMLGKQASAFSNAQAALVTRWAWAEEKAYSIGVHVERLLIYSADVIEYRMETLREFNERYIKPSLQELIDLMRNRQFEKTRNHLLEAGFERILELGKEVLLTIAEEDPQAKAAIMTGKAARILKGHGTDLSVGGTGHLNLLVSQLRNEAALIELVTATYDDAMKELRDLDAAMG